MTTTALDIEEVSPLAFRRVMSTFATGVAVITTELDGKPFGMTVNSLTSVSLTPPTLLVCLKRGSSTAEAVRSRRVFGVNILSEMQAHLSRQFCGPFEERFTDVEIARDEEGTPFLENALAHMRCRLKDIYEFGDHDIFFGGVESCSSADGSPLVFHGGQFGTLAR